MSRLSTEEIQQRIDDAVERLNQMVLDEMAAVEGVASDLTIEVEVIAEPATE